MAKEPEAVLSKELVRPDAEASPIVDARDAIGEAATAVNRYWCAVGHIGRREAGQVPS